MTVAELIAALQALPADARVLVEGYETGWDAIHAVEMRSIEPCPNAEPWDGEFREGGHQPAVVILGRREIYRSDD